MLSLAGKLWSLDQTNNLRAHDSMGIKVMGDIVMSKRLFAARR